MSDPMPEPIPDRGGRFVRDPETGALAPVPDAHGPAAAAAEPALPAAEPEVTEEPSAIDPASADPADGAPTRKRK